MNDEIKYVRKECEECGAFERPCNCPEAIKKWINYLEGEKQEWSNADPEEVPVDRIMESFDKRIKSYKEKLKKVKNR